VNGSAHNIITNAASTGVRIDRRRLKSLARRSDRPGIVHLALWAAALLGAGTLVWAALGTFLVWPAMFLLGVVTSVPAYSLSHETAHGTAFRSRWLNETVFWFTSLLYGEEPLHRRYTHTNHHTYTWYIIQHAEMQENSTSIVESTRTFRTNWAGRFLYLNMNHHVEHHLYPQVPFYALPRLHQEVAEQTPKPDPGFWCTNLDLLSVVVRRSLGRGTKGVWIRQAPHMVTAGGGYERIARATMQ